MEMPYETAPPTRFLQCRAGQGGSNAAPLPRTPFPRWVKAALDLIPITESESKPQRRFAPNDLIGFLRKTDRHQIGTVIGIVGIAT